MSPEHARERTPPEAAVAAARARSEQVLAAWLERSPGISAALDEALRYSVLGSGKRLRPVLVYLAGQALGAQSEALDPAAAALEMIHAYSLVHDDLPAMDDDDLRRGRPTVHRAFDEPLAILAGDALQTLAFEVLASREHPRLAALVTTLAQAAGRDGMAAGLRPQPAQRRAAQPNGRRSGGVRLLQPGPGDPPGSGAPDPQRCDHGDRAFRLPQPGQQCPRLPVHLPWCTRCSRPCYQRRNEDGCCSCNCRFG